MRGSENAPDGIEILPRLVEYPPALTLVYLLLKEVAVIGAVGAMMGRSQAVLARTKEEVAVHAWQLERLLPRR